TAFSVKPLSVLANDPNGVTGRARVGTTPIIHWNDLVTIKSAACPGGGTATATLNPGNGAGSTNVTLAETPAGSGIYVGGNTAPLNPGHDNSPIHVTEPSSPG